MASQKAGTKPLERFLLSAVLTALLPLADAAPDHGGQPPANDAADPPSCIDDLLSERGPRTALIALDDREGKWELATTVSRVDGTMTFYACLPSEPAPDHHADALAASLFVVCGIGGDDKALIAVPQHRFRSRVPVISRFDEDRTEACEWEASPDRKALLAPGTAGGFAARLRGHETLSLRLTMRGRGKVRFEFDLRGAPESLDLLARACRWSRFGDYYRSARPCEAATAQAVEP